jgi:hypothetical protein
MLRAVVEEREYAVAARVSEVDDGGEELPRSDRLATAFHIQQRAEALCGRPVSVVEDEDGVAAVVTLGDALEPEFEETAVLLLEAASW